MSPAPDVPHRHLRAAGDQHLEGPRAPSALGLKVRTKVLSRVQAGAALEGFERSLDASFVAAAQPLGLEAELLVAPLKPPY
jgi:hypothetical protein